MRVGAGGHAGEEFVAHGVIERIGIGGDTIFEVEEAIGVAIDFIFGGGGQADEQRIEIGKDGAVFLENGAVGLVDDDEIEMADAETTLTVFGLVFSFLVPKYATRSPIGR